MRLHQPIPSENFTGDKCAAMGCTACGCGWVDLDAACSQHPTACPRCGSLRTGPRFEPAERCGNCGTIDWDLPVGRYCSRVCQLQGEYAESLVPASKPLADVVPIQVARLSR